MLQDDPIASVVQTYHELNPTVVDELQSLPDPLEFMRYVARNRPFVVRQGATEWKALRKWDANYLRETMRGRSVKVATTPLGNADAVVEDKSGILLFAQPYEIVEDFEEFLSAIQEGSVPSKVSDTKIDNVKYAQTQNDNLRDEYLPLFPDVPPSLDFVDSALQQEPDAVNFWLGTARSTTALHKDNYENIYIQIRGRKHFTLLPPVEMPCVNETSLPQARYRPSPDDPQKLGICIDEAGEEVPVPVWDPDLPEQRSTPYSHLSKASRVTLEEGDMMYLPAMWYHKVGQSCGDEGFACSVNYWYDMDFSGGFWSSNAFLRDIVSKQRTEVAYPDLVLAADE